MAGLKGKSTEGVGKDIVDFLTAVATHFNIDIVVTSGKRSPEGQAKAMFDNWIKLKRGAVYATAALPVADRQKLDAYYKTAKENALASTADKVAAQQNFLKLAKDKVGNKSRHSSGRAVDVTQASVNASVYKAITLFMKEVKEGNRTDIYHFESSAVIPPITQQTKDKFSALNQSPAGGIPSHSKIAGSFVASDDTCLA